MALHKYETLLVLGYNSPGDGGGGDFVWEPDNVTPADGGLAFAPADGGHGRWTRLLPDPGVISPLYFGARCDGATDDAAAINAAVNHLRRQFSIGDMEPIAGEVRLPAKQCVAGETINLTRLGSASAMLVGSGGSILCKTSGKPCLDAANSPRLAMRDITLYGDPKTMPNVGLLVARPSRSGSAAGMYLDRVSISGYYSLAAFYNLNAETQLALKLNASNSAPNGYGAIYDGMNHFHIVSDFQPLTEPVDWPESFNDNSCVNCRITSSGVGGVPLWIGATAELTFENSYISNFSNGPGAILYSWNTNLNFDAHFEATKLTSIFLFEGQRHLKLYGFKYREHDFFGQTSMFALGPQVDTVTLHDVEIAIGNIHGHGTWFDQPRHYQVTGWVSGVKSTGWVVPGGGFSGAACFDDKCVWN